LLGRDGGDLFGAMPAMREPEPSRPRELLWDELDLPGVPAAPAYDDDNGGFAPGPAPTSMPVPQRGGAIDGHLLALLSLTPISLDDLVRSSGYPAREVGRALVEMELAGQVQRHAGGGLTRSPV
jgi:DNA processing protein